jgi:Chloroplast import apparatus Tic20-like/EF-hand domain pair
VLPVVSLTPVHDLTQFAVIESPGTPSAVSHLETPVASCSHKTNKHPHTKIGHSNTIIASNIGTTMTRNGSLLIYTTILTLTVNPVSSFAPVILSQHQKSNSIRNIASSSTNHNQGLARLLGGADLNSRADETSSLARLHMSNNSKGDETESEIDRLRQMAAKLRAEAASLEAEQSRAVADAAERAFKKFDKNQDGEVTLQELKEGLEKSFNMELPAKRVEALMRDFDKSNDGKLQAGEFATLDVFRSRLDALAREEKEQARQAVEVAKREQDAVALLQAQLDRLNDRPPTTADKFLSVLPYLFPLLDGLQFARFFVVENPDNPVAIALGLLYAVYRLIPFGGLIAFFTLSFLSGNPSINRLIRFNMQQAIYLDIALVVPGLIGAVIEIVGGGKTSPAVFELGSDAIFGLILLTIGYTTISSLVGATPDKIPFISAAANARIPSIDMFDADGRFDPSRTRKKDEEKDNKSD